MSIMSDGICLVSQMTSDTYSNSVGNKIVVIKIKNDVMMTAKEITKLYGISRPYIIVTLSRLFRNKTLVKK